MEDLVYQSESLAMEVQEDLEMPRIQRNLSQLLAAGNQLWAKAANHNNRDVSHVRASVLLGGQGYDFQKVSRNLDSLISRGVKHSLESHPTQPLIRETDIRGFLKNERENAILKVIDEIKQSSKEQVENQYWHTLTRDWDKKQLALLHSFTRPNQTDGDEIVSKEIYDDQGLYEAAVKLYDPTSCSEKVLEILIKLLSNVLATRKSENSEKERYENLAIRVADSYYGREVNIPRETTGVFYLLLDLITFFNHYHANQYCEALDIIQRLELLPFSSNEVQIKSREFDKYPEEIRRNIADILLATMNTLQEINKKNPSSEIKQKARALITFSGMIQYRMPSEAIARLIELEALIK